MSDPDHDTGLGAPLRPEERAVAGALLQPPRAEFRAELLGRFLGAVSGTAGEASQVRPYPRTAPVAADGSPSGPTHVKPYENNRSPGEAPPTAGGPLSPSERRLAEVLAPSSGPWPQWRQSQRSAFVTRAAAASALPARQPELRRAPPGRQPFLPAQRRLRLVASGLAIAAAAFLILWPAASADPRWELNGDVGAVAVQHAALRNGVLLQDETAQLDCAGGPTSLDLDGRVRVEMVPGSVARFCPPRSREGVLVVPIELLSGELLVHLDPRLGPTRIMVQTPEGVVNLTGTSLSILREDAGTCVCVASGSVRIEVKGQNRPPLDVAGGTSAFLFASGAAPRVVVGEERLGFFGGEAQWLQHERNLTRSLGNWNKSQR